MLAMVPIHSVKLDAITEESFSRQSPRYFEVIRFEMFVNESNKNRLLTIEKGPL